MGLGAETAFVGRAVLVVVGGVWAFCYGGSPRRRTPSRTRRRTVPFVFFEVGWGRLGCGLAGGGGVGAVVMDAPPLPPLLLVAHPTPSHAPQQPLILLPRIPHLLHASPLVGPKVTRRHPNDAHHTRGLPVMETAQESKAQGWVSGHDAVEVPQGYFRGSLSVSQGHPDGPGLRRIDPDVYDLETLKKNSTNVN